VTARRLNTPLRMDIMPHPAGLDMLRWLSRKLREPGDPILPRVPLGNPVGGDTGGRAHSERIELDPHPWWGSIQAIRNGFGPGGPGSKIEAREQAQVTFRVIILDGIAHFRMESAGFE